MINFYSMKNKTQFHLNLIKLRKERGLSQVELAKKAGVTQRVIAYYENECGNPPLDKVENLAKALNVSVDELTGSNKHSHDQVNFLNLDTRTLKKIELILSLDRNDRHIVYSLVDSLVQKKNKTKSS